MKSLLSLFAAVAAVIMMVNTANAESKTVRDVRTGMMIQVDCGGKCGQVTLEVEGLPQAPPEPVRVMDISDGLVSKVTEAVTKHQPRWAFGAESSYLSVREDGLSMLATGALRFWRGSVGLELAAGAGSLIMGPGDLFAFTGRAGLLWAVSEKVTLVPVGYEYYGAASVKTTPVQSYLYRPEVRVAVSENFQLTVFGRFGWGVLSRRERQENGSEATKHRSGIAAGGGVGVGYVW